MSLINLLQPNPLGTNSAFDELKLKAHGNTLESGTNRMSFDHLLKDAISKVNDAQNVAETEKLKFELNDPKASLANVMLTTQKANIAFQLALQTRNKVINAYKEIMSIQV